MKKQIWGLFLIVPFQVLSSCQSVTEIPLPAQTSPATATVQSPTQTSEPTATLVPLSAKVLGGLIISSPILGIQYVDTDFQLPEKFTVNGLGIINLDGTLTRFAEVGLFESVSPSGVKIVYQHGYENEYADRLDDLYVYDALTGQTTQIVEDLENEGGKTVLAWSQDEQSFIYYNDYLRVLFEAYGYFGTRQLLWADATTGQTKLWIRDAYQFDVSPDQTQIAYTTGEILESKTVTFGDQALQKFGCFQPRIYDIAASISQPFDISQLDEKPLCMGYPKWSPDGTKIAWIGYFEDDMFRPIIFDLQHKTARTYEALKQKPRSSMLPTEWFLGEPIDPTWVEHSIFWTPSYEVNVETGEAFTPRAIELPYDPWSRALHSPDQSLSVVMNATRDTIILKDRNQSFLASYLLDDLYKGPRQEILISNFVLQGVNKIVGWSPFVPPPMSGTN